MTTELVKQVNQLAKKNKTSTIAAIREIAETEQKNPKSLQIQYYKEKREGTSGTRKLQAKKKTKKKGKYSGGKKKRVSAKTSEAARDFEIVDFLTSSLLKEIIVSSRMLSGVNQTEDMVEVLFEAREKLQELLGDQS
jgi:hypothetical protein